MSDVVWGDFSATKEYGMNAGGRGCEGPFKSTGSRSPTGRPIFTACIWRSLFKHDMRTAKTPHFPAKSRLGLPTRDAEPNNNWDETATHAERPNSTPSAKRKTQANTNREGPTPNASQHCGKLHRRARKREERRKLTPIAPMRKGQHPSYRLLAELNNNKILSVRYPIIRTVYGT